MESADLAAVWLTLKLATIVTVLLLLIGTPIAWWLARTRSRLQGGGRRRRRPAAGPAADRARLLPAGGHGAARAGRAIHAMARHRPAALHLRRAGRRLGGLLAAFRRPADPERLRSDRRASAGSRRDPARQPLGRLLVGRRAAGQAGLPVRRHSRLRAHRRRIRHRADDRRQHPGQDARRLGRRSTTTSRRWNTRRPTGWPAAWCCSASSCCSPCTPSTRPGGKRYEPGNSRQTSSSTAATSCSMSI